MSGRLKKTAKTTRWWMVDYGDAYVPSLFGSKAEAKEEKARYTMANDWMPRPRVVPVRVTVLRALIPNAGSR